MSRIARNLKKGESKPESQRDCAPERGSEKETRNPKLGMTFIHGRFHHFPRHHLSWWPLHCYTLHNTLIESMSTNLYAFYRFAIYFIVHNRDWALTARLSLPPSSTHTHTRSTHSYSFPLHSVSFFSLHKLGICLFRLPFAFNRKPYRYDRPRVWIVCTVHELVPIDICAIERYNWEWQYEFIVIVCL